MKRFATFVLAASISVTALATSLPSIAQADANGSVATDMKTRLAIMTFNVENLFDTLHDEGKDDETFLPLAYKKAHPEAMAKCDEQSTDFYRQQCRETDWSEEVFEAKITNVAEAIRNVNGGRGPDILGFVEVENINALNQLNNRKLADLNYQTVVLIEGPDQRGIDTGLMSRLPQWDKAQLHIVPYVDQNGKPDKAGSRSRGILEVRLMLPGNQKAAVFVAHFPSQGNPTYLRKQAVAELNRLKAALPKDVVAMAMGDFNITAEEDAQSGYIKHDLAADWMVSHIVGCKSCKGTHAYKKTWSFLDILAFSPSLDESAPAVFKSGWALDVNSITVPTPTHTHMNRFGEPNRFNPPSSGVSDHWPLYAELYVR